MILLASLIKQDQPWTINGEEMVTGGRGVDLGEKFLSMTSNLNCSLGAYVFCK